jgi:hypothetical protein
MERHCLQVGYDLFPEDPDTPIASGRIVAWGNETVGGRDYIQLKGYADPLVGEQLLEGAVSDNGFVWCCREPEDDGEWPAVPVLSDLVLIRGTNIIGGSVRVYDDGVRGATPGAPGRTRPQDGAGVPHDGTGAPGDRAVDIGATRDDAAATVRAFNGL